ncbi:HAMP domain-containing protein, partial [Billgrantia sp. Q4P2]|uniref:HAMP domain-containing protein n=1 Tax=Billgrantia sp. Q4P2 TaxID=3463857 RepID=UPI004056A033
MKAKIGGLLTVALVAVLLAAGTGAWGIRIMGQALEVATVAAQAQRNHIESDMMHDALRADVLAAFKAAADGSGFSEVKSGFHKHAFTFNEKLAANQALELPEEIRRALAEVEAPLAAYIDKAETLIASAESDIAAAQALFPGFIDDFHTLEDAMEAVSDRIEAVILATQAATQQTTTEAVAKLLLVSLVAFVLLLVGGTFLILSIARAVTAALNFSRAVSAGDLTATAAVASRDELGDLAASLNAMVAKLREVVGEVTGAVRNVASGSQEMAATSEQLSQGATEQAASAEEASSSMEQM